MFTPGISIYRGKKRSPMFTGSGHFFAFLLVSTFVSVYALLSFQLVAWKTYFFRGTVSLQESCGYSAIATDTVDLPREALLAQPLSPISIPHDTKVLTAELGTQKPYYHVRYRCLVESKDFRDAKGVIYLHTGWIFGAEIAVLINDQTRVSSHGNDKPTVPLTQADLKKELFTIDIFSSSPRMGYFGMVGAQPMTIGVGSAVNARIFGLETSLQTTFHLLILLPILTLGLVLVFSWILGNRSRLMLGAFFFFVASATENVFSLFGDLWPWNIEITFLLSNPLTMGTGLAFLVFGTQILEVAPRYIIHLIIGVVGLLSLEFVALFLSSDPNSLVVSQLNMFKIVIIVASLVLILLGVRNTLRADLDRPRRNVNLVFLVFTGVFAVALGFEIYFRVFNTMFYPLVQFVYLLMPFFVGGVLLYTISLIEKNYQIEKTAREKMEHDLDLAREIQDSLAPPPAHLYSGNLRVTCHQVKHHQVAGDWMAVREMPNGELIALVADATGKGMQAALVIHAIQSLWADTLGETNFDPDAWIARVNRSLVRLGETKKHSMTLGLIRISGDELKYWSAGHLPLFVCESEASGDPNASRLNVKPVVAKGSVVGLNPEIKLEPASYKIGLGKNTTILLGSDGVFTKGSRSGRREITELVGRLELGGKAALLSIEVEDDKTLVIIEKTCLQNDLSA